MNHYNDLGKFLVAPSDSQEISILLKAWGNGDQAALDRLTPLVYAELHCMARRHMRTERENTLQTTALVHEAYLRLVDAKGLACKDRTHFFALSAQVMRRILVDAARARVSAKRGGDATPLDHSEGLNLDEIAGNASQKSADVLAMDQALEDLARVDARKARVIELRFFGGLSVEETAEVLQISPQSVMRDWKLARAWLVRELG
ncbi:MAG TPA: sigma-70 family RNA polymerase sigma factor [Bryobacteraceae bacterium]|nr:sigma-70 family RNA polymerase sigma factor [Bryobacteraceae bacterium]